MRGIVSLAAALALPMAGNRGAVSEEVLHQLEQELDLEALRLGAGELRDSA